MNILSKRSWSMATGTDGVVIVNIVSRRRRATAGRAQELSQASACVSYGLDP